MNTAVIGTGYISDIHAAALLSLGIRITAVCGVAEQYTAAFAEKWNVPGQYTDYRKIPLENLDCVHVCTPPAEHYSLCRYFILNGIPVICEKPLTLKAEEAEELTRLSAERGVPFAVCFNNRFYPAVQEIQKLSAGRELGEPVLLYGSYEQEFHIPPVMNSWRFDAEAGNDLRAVSEIGSHMLDLIQFLRIGRVERVSALFRNGRDVLYRNGENILSVSPERNSAEFPLQNEDTAAIQLILSEGTVISLVLSEISAGKGNHLNLRCISQNGRMEWDNQLPDCLCISREKGSEIRRCAGMQSGVTDSFREMFRDFYTALREKGISRMTSAAEAYENVRICRAILSSARQGGACVSVETGEGRAADSECLRKRKRRDALIHHYRMQLLPEEHTLYSENYHSPDRNGEGRRLASTMYGIYSRDPLSYSAFHRLSREEIWTYLEGDPLVLYLLYGDGSSEEVILGPDVENGEKMQYTVPRDVIQGGCLRQGGEYALYSCTVVPEFTPDCFSMVGKEELLQRFPEKAELIHLLCDARTEMRNSEKF